MLKNDWQEEYLDSFVDAASLAASLAEWCKDVNKSQQV